MGDSESSDDDKPLALRAPARPAVEAQQPNKRKRPQRTADSSSDGDNEPESRKRGSKSGKKAAEIRWHDLQHAGVLFPPDYVAHGVKMLYDGQPVELTPAQVWLQGSRSIRAGGLPCRAPPASICTCWALPSLLPTTHR